MNMSCYRHWPSSNLPPNSDGVTYVKQATSGIEHLQNPLRDNTVIERERFYRERYFYTGRKWVFLIRSRWGLLRYCSQIYIVSFVVLLGEELNTVAELFYCILSATSSCWLLFCSSLHFRHCRPPEKSISLFRPSGKLKDEEEEETWYY